MNQGQLEVVKQEIAGLNVNILGISEIKWTGMGEFNSDDHYIYYCGQECLRRNEIAIMVKKKSRKCSTCMQSQKRPNDLCGVTGKFGLGIWNEAGKRLIDFPKKLHCS